MCGLCVPDSDLVFNWLPTPGVGSRSRRSSVHIISLGHAPLERSAGIPTLERGNENHRFPRGEDHAFSLRHRRFSQNPRRRLFHVDRTDRIALLEETGSQLLFLRPRRFGKSLWLSTLENYYDLARADDFKRLFGGLKIGQNPTPLRNRYFILNLNFSVVDPKATRTPFALPLFHHLNIQIKATVARYGDWLGVGSTSNPTMALPPFNP